MGVQIYKFIILCYRFRSFKLVIVGGTVFSVSVNPFNKSSLLEYICVIC